MNTNWYGACLFQPKYETNVGGALRSAAALGCSNLHIIGKRYRKYCTDTSHAPTLIPLWEYDTFEQFRLNRPHDAVFVGVEITPDAIPLETFTHPKRCIYILGPEDGGLSQEVLDRCKYVVQIDTRFCLNLSSAATVVFYDRQAKLLRESNDGYRR